jgi:hypothetical protein
MTEPLSTRMRIAADTLEDLAKHLEYTRPDFIVWSAKDLRNEAKHMEDEEKEADERETIINELAEALREAELEVSRGAFLPPIAVARSLVENGWTKP